MQGMSLVCSPEEVLASKQAMEEERRDAERELGCVLVHCPLCLTTLLADDIAHGDQKLAAHLDVRHRRES